MTAFNGDSRIVVTGSLAYDHIMDFPGYFRDHILPDKAHVINLSFLVGELKKQRGGCAANIAYGLALLGERARVVGAAGGDFGDYLQWLRDRGVDVEGIRIFEDEITASCFITTDRADNQITGFYMGAMRRAGEISLSQSAGGSARLCLVAPDEPEAMIRHCREARALGLDLIFDPSFQVTAMNGDSLREGMRGARGLMLNDYEFAVFCQKTGWTRQEILEEVDFLVVTLGEKGSEVSLRGGERIAIPPARPRQVVDPTGAGDAYRSGFLAGLMRELPLPVCARLGSVAAVYAVESYGTQNYGYDMAEFRARYRENFGSPPWD